MICLWTSTIFVIYQNQQNKHLQTDEVEIGSKISIIFIIERKIKSEFSKLTNC